MSNVPKSKRKTSSVEFVYNAALLYHFTLDCCMRLPKRWTFLVTERTVDAAAKVLEHAKAANSIYVTYPIDAQLRRAHLLEAYCSAQVLSSYVDEIYMRFPSKKETGKPCISQAWYLQWVECIDKEFSLLKGLLRSDSQRFKHLLKEEQATISNPKGGMQLSFFDLEDTLV